MLRSMKDLSKYTFEAKDGDVGRVRDFLFDDSTWGVRYMVLDTGRWLPGQQVLLSPQSIKDADGEDQKFHLDLTKEKIEQSPGPAEDSPVSRQHEQELHAHYGWEAHWMAVPGAMGTAPAAPHVRTGPAGSEKEAEALAAGDADPHLRSLLEVMKYDTEASDDSIGTVTDLLCDDEDWTVRYLVLDTRKWLPGGKSVLVATEWLSDIDWQAQKVSIELTKDKIKDAPEFDPHQPVNRKYEERLYDYYGRPRYWSADLEHQPLI